MKQMKMVDENIFLMNINFDIFKAKTKGFINGRVVKLIQHYPVLGMVDFRVHNNGMKTNDNGWSLPWIQSEVFVELYDSYSTG